MTSYYVSNARVLIFICVFLSASLAYARDQIKIVGSSTVYPFSTVVGERFGMRGFKTPIVESTGTGGGISLFCQGVGANFPDIVNASRAMNESEISLCKQRGVDFIEVPIGSDGIALANSVSGQKIELTKRQLWEALAAKGTMPKMWSDIAPTLPRMKIVVLVPPHTSGTRDAWGELVMQVGCSNEVKTINKKNCLLMRDDGAVVEVGENDSLIIQKLQANSSAFGIFGFSYYDSNVDQLQAAKIEGADISLENIQDNSYPISRPLFFYVKKAHIDVIPGIREYIREFISDAALSSDGYLSDLGLVPFSAEKLSEIRRMIDINSISITRKTSR